MLHHGVKPYFVFDGNNLPAKAGTEAERKANRDEALRLGLELRAKGDTQGANAQFSRAVDVTPALAHRFIRVLMSKQIPFIVAPYEADAQLAYLCINGIVDAVVSEDSDLIPYGCQRVLFKMDRAGEGKEVQRARLGMCEGLKLSSFTDDMFLDMCILSGCDYLDNIPGIGLQTACSLVMHHGKAGAKNLFKQLAFQYATVMPAGYPDTFKLARLTFRHQRVFDPRSQKMVCLKPLDIRSMGVNDPADKRLDFLGPWMDDAKAAAIANGIIDPSTGCEYPAPLVRQVHAAAGHRHGGGASSAAGATNSSGGSGGSSSATSTGGGSNRPKHLGEWAATDINARSSSSSYSNNNDMQKALMYSRGSSKQPAGAAGAGSAASGGGSVGTGQKSIMSMFGSRAATGSNGIATGSGSKGAGAGSSASSAASTGGMQPPQYPQQAQFHAQQQSQPSKPTTQLAPVRSGYFASSSSSMVPSSNRPTPVGAAAASAPSSAAAGASVTAGSGVMIDLSEDSNHATEAAMMMTAGPGVLAADGVKPAGGGDCADDNDVQIHGGEVARTTLGALSSNSLVTPAVGLSRFKKAAAGNDAAGAASAIAPASVLTVLAPAVAMVGSSPSSSSGMPNPSPPTSLFAFGKTTKGTATKQLLSAFAFKTPAGSSSTATANATGTVAAGSSSGAGGWHGDTAVSSASSSVKGARPGAGGAGVGPSSFYSSAPIAAAMIYDTNSESFESQPSPSREGSCGGGANDEGDADRVAVDAFKAGSHIVTGADAPMSSPLPASQLHFETPGPESDHLHDQHQTMLQQDTAGGTSSSAAAAVGSKRTRRTSPRAPHQAASSPASTKQLHKPVAAAAAAAAIIVDTVVTTSGGAQVLLLGDRPDDECAVEAEEVEIDALGRQKQQHANTNNRASKRARSSSGADSAASDTGFGSGTTPVASSSSAAAASRAASTSPALNTRSSSSRKRKPEAAFKFSDGGNAMPSVIASSDLLGDVSTMHAVGLLESKGRRGAGNGKQQRGIDAAAAVSCRGSNPGDRFYSAALGPGMTGNARSGGNGRGGSADSDSASKAIRAHVPQAAQIDFSQFRYNVDAASGGQGVQAAIKANALTGAGAKVTNGSSNSRATGRAPAGTSGVGRSKGRGPLGIITIAAGKSGTSSDAAGSAASASAAVSGRGRGSGKQPLASRAVNLGPNAIGASGIVVANAVPAGSASAVPATGAGVSGARGGARGRAITPLMARLMHSAGAAAPASGSASPAAGMLINDENLPSANSSKKTRGHQIPAPGTGEYDRMDGDRRLQQHNPGGAGVHVTHDGDAEARYQYTEESGQGAAAAVGVQGQQDDEQQHYRYDRGQHLSKASSNNSSIGYVSSVRADLQARGLMATDDDSMLQHIHAQSSAHTGSCAGSSSGHSAYGHPGPDHYPAQPPQSGYAIAMVAQSQALAATTTSTSFMQRFIAAQPPQPAPSAPALSVYGYGDGHVHHSADAAAATAVTSSGYRRFVQL